MSYLGSWWSALTVPRESAARVLSDEPRGFNAFLLLIIVTAYAFYGASMGLFGGAWPATVSAMKFPLLHLGTLAVCLLPFYTMMALARCPIPMRSCIRLLLLLASANAIAVASYVPISAFYGLTTSDSGYAFLFVMHFFVLACAGGASLTANLLVLHGTSSALKNKFTPRPLFVWGTLYGIVGIHLAWTLRPWISKPSLEYSPFRPIGHSLITSAIEHFRTYTGW